MISEKPLCSKDFTRDLRGIFTKIIVIIMATNLVTNSLFVCSFRRNQKQEPYFQLVGDLVSKNISKILWFENFEP